MFCTARASTTEEPDAGKPHVRICVGGFVQMKFLPLLSTMNKKSLGLNEIIILVSLVGMLLILAVRFWRPELLIFTFISTRLGSFLFGCLFLYFSYNEFKRVKESECWFANRLAGVIRVPLYVAASIYLYYLAVNGGINT